MYDGIIDELAPVVEQEVKDVAGDLGKLEEVVLRKVMVIGRGLLQRVIDRGGKEYQGSSLGCECGGSKRFVEYRSRELLSLFGPVQMERAYYHCRGCGSSSVPYDQRRGLGPERISPGLARVCCMLAVDDSFEETSRKIEELFGLRVSDDTIDRMVHHVGSVAGQEQQSQLEAFFRTRQVPAGEFHPQRLYVAVDGTTVREEDGFHEVKMGSIYWQEEGFERQTRYVGSFEPSERFGWRVWHEACRCGLGDAREVIYLGDGAPWIRHEHHNHFGRATFIIDWYHVTENLWKCGKKLFGEVSAAASEWVKVRKGLLWEGKVEEVLCDLLEQTKRYRGERKEAIEDLHRYISTNADQMRYDVFRAKGYDIGSGSVEGACKHVVGKRLKQSGMKWSRTGSSATLALRIVWLNKKWDDLWSKKPLAA